MKKILLFVASFLMLFVCGCHNTHSEQIADLAQWITYDQIVVGSTDVKTVEKNLYGIYLSSDLDSSETSGSLMSFLRRIING